MKLLLPFIFTAPSKTKSTLLLLMIALLAGTQSNAQTNVYHPFPDTNAVWNTNYGYKDNSSCWVRFSRSYIQKGDTTINSIQYNKLYLNEQTWIQPIVQLGCSLNTYPGITTTGIFKGGLRNDIPNKKVYYYDALKNIECLLYDFTLKTKDTAWNCGKVGTMGGPPYVLITSIDSILIGGKYHKRFNNNGASTSGIIEGVGGLTGLLEPRAFFEDGGALECFSVLSQPLYYNSSANCGVVGVNESLSLNTFEIYPNPSKGTFTIESSEKILSLEVLNMMGENIFSASASHKQETVNLSSQPNGIYFLKLKTERGSISKKIIIQH